MTQTIKKIDETTTMVYGTIDMFIPEGGSHVRQAIILIPCVSFIGNPTVTVTIYNNTPGTVFGVWAIDKVQQTGQYEVKVSATNVVKCEESNGYFYCDYIIIGEN
jgi:hypothetical protein